MLHAAAQDRAGPLPLQRLVEEPQELERGLKVLDVGLRLAPGLVVDLVLRDSASRPVVVLGEGEGGPEALLGRAICVLAEVRRMRDLLDRLFRQEGVSFGADPRVILVARRFSDALHSARDLLRPFTMELVEARELSVEGRSRLVVVRAGGGATIVAAPPAPDLPPSESGNGAAPPRETSLVDEAKKKILRISDDIEEEVDGGLIRFRLHDELIAALELGADGCAITIGDSPDRRRVLVERSDLNAAIDDVVRRYFTLARHFAAKPAARRAGAGTSS
jgi:hypothetical protein